MQLDSHKVSYRAWAVRLALLVISSGMILTLPQLLGHKSRTPAILNLYDLDYFLVVTVYLLILVASIATTVVVFWRNEVLDRWLLQTVRFRRRFALISALIIGTWLLWLIPFTWGRGFEGVKNIETAVEIAVYAFTIMLAFLYEGEHATTAILSANQRKRWLIIMAVGFTIFALVFIYRTSFIAIDGQRYFSLFDDAMISMRYAWHLANGHGLVWNPGEYVEGYTNLLMTLLMALANLIFKFDKRYAVLSIQLIGIPVVLGIAYLTAKLAEHLRKEFNLPDFFILLIFFASLAYYPLIYFSLMGMETGLLTLLLLAGTLAGFSYLDRRKLQHFIALPLILGLAFLTRPDSLIIAALILGYVSYELIREQPKASTLLRVGGLALLYLLLPVLQQIFRVAYYGDIVPNTYTLKMMGMPIGIRLMNGFNFLGPFLWNILLPLILVITGLILKPSIKGLFLFAIPAALIAYQIWVGGDVWDYWRMLAPGMPFFLLLLAALTFFLSHRLLPNNYSYALIGSAIVTACLLHVNVDFLPEMVFRVPPYDFAHNQRNVNWAVALNQVTTPDATIGVFSAGTLPYYVDRYAIDFLGKADRRIALLEPDLSGAIAGNRMTSLPGHNKYDLQYSIVELRPTFVMAFKWGSQDLREWAENYYVLVEYQGVELYLLRDSENVKWELLDVTVAPH